MKTIDDINLYTWFMDRELSFVPDHFSASTTPVTPEAKEWILEKLTGRFALKSTGLISQLPYFEDPKEAIFYELKWG